MAQSETTSRAQALKAAGDLARTSVESMVKDAVAEAMREVETEQGTAGSNRRRVPAALLLLAIGALIGYAVATRGGGTPFETEGFGQAAEPESPDMTTTEEGSTTTGAEEDDGEPVDTVTES